jgi:hypothetical protein
VSWVGEMLGETVIDHDPTRKAKAYSSWVSALNGFDREADDSLNAGRLTFRECHAAWTYFTPLEKLVIWQVATQGLSNPKNNDSLNRLVERGIVRYESLQFALASRDLNDFIKGDLVMREMEILFPPRTDSAWRGLSRTLIYLFLLTVLVAVVTVADLWGSSLVQFLTFGGAVWPAVKIAYDAVSGSREKSDKAA